MCRTEYTELAMLEVDRILYGGLTFGCRCPEHESNKKLSGLCVYQTVTEKDFFSDFISDLFSWPERDEIEGIRV
jgi:hypothetical protein